MGRHAGPTGPNLRCHAHCVNCGRHFTGDGAFDAHRVGPPDHRVCAWPASVTARDGHTPRLVIKSGQGQCTLIHPPIVTEPVVLWQLAGSAEVAGRFGR